MGAPSFSAGPAGTKCRSRPVRSCSVSSKHLPHYVDEFVFRFNRRRTPMAAFQSLLGLTAQYAPTTYKMLYAAEPTG